MMRHRFGVGFNPCFLDGKLDIPGASRYVEAGASAFCTAERLAILGAPRAALSLHLARAPLSEDDAFQDRFIDDVCETSSATPLESIGVHLCGPYRSGLGRWGLGSEFDSTPAATDQAIRFASRLRSNARLPVLIENANYYDCSLASALTTIAAANEIARIAQIEQILDLAHLAANAHNVGVEPWVLIGAVDLRTVRIVHLSGIVVGRDGLWHDGHSEPVHEVVWRLLAFVLSNTSSTITVVLEHSNACWATKVGAFDADVAKALGTLERSEATQEARRPIDSIALSYLTNVVMPEDFPELADSLGHATFRELVLHWGATFLSRVGTNEIVSYSNTGLRQCAYVNPRDDFAAFVERELLDRGGAA